MEQSRGGGWPHDAGPHKHYKYLHNKEIIGEKLAVVTIVIPFAYVSYTYLFLIYLANLRT